MKINCILKQGQRQSWMHPLSIVQNRHAQKCIYRHTDTLTHPNTYVNTHIKVEGRLCQEDVWEKAGTRSEYGQSTWYNWIQRSSGYLITLYYENTLRAYFLIRKASLIFNFKMPGNCNYQCIWVFYTAESAYICIGYLQTYLHRDDRNAQNHIEKNLCRARTASQLRKYCLACRKFWVLLPTCYYKEGVSADTYNPSIWGVGNEWSKKCKVIFGLRSAWETWDSISTNK